LSFTQSHKYSDYITDQHVAFHPIIYFVALLYLLNFSQCFGLTNFSRSLVNKFDTRIQVSPNFQSSSVRRHQSNASFNFALLLSSILLKWLTLLWCKDLWCMMFKSSFIRTCRQVTNRQSACPNLDRCACCLLLIL
jgi:hypothetical protein